MYYVERMLARSVNYHCHTLLLLHIDVTCNFTKTQTYTWHIVVFSKHNHQIL